eukprot:359936-Chlamydomonas_euryale.AAC.6
MSGALAYVALDQYHSFHISARDARSRRCSQRGGCTSRSCSGRNCGTPAAARKQEGFGALTRSLASSGSPSAIVSYGSLRSELTRQPLSGSRGAKWPSLARQRPSPSLNEKRRCGHGCQVKLGRGRANLPAAFHVLHVPAAAPCSAQPGKDRRPHTSWLCAAVIRASHSKHGGSGWTAGRSLSGPASEVARVSRRASIHGVGDGLCACCGLDGEQPRSAAMQPVRQPSATLLQCRQSHACIAGWSENSTDALPDCMVMVCISRSVGSKLLWQLRSALCRKCMRHSAQMQRCAMIACLLASFGAMSYLCPGLLHGGESSWMSTFCLFCHACLQR